MSIRTGRPRCGFMCIYFPNWSLILSKLRDKVKDALSRERIYHQLCVLRWKIIHNVFERMLPGFLKALLSTVLTYFTAYLSDREISGLYVLQKPRTPWYNSAYRIVSSSFETRLNERYDFFNAIKMVWIFFEENDSVDVIDWLGYWWKWRCFTTSNIAGSGGKF